VKNVDLWDVSPCGSCRNRCFRGTYRLYLQGENNQRNKNTLAISTMQRIPLVSTRTTRRHIPEGDILHSHRCENLISYIGSIVFEHLKNDNRIENFSSDATASQKKLEKHQNTKH
jgi:hypothetical protein